jgi:hypothetical protein
MSSLHVGLNVFCPFKARDGESDAVYTSIVAAPEGKVAFRKTLASIRKTLALICKNVACIQKTLASIC